MNKIKEVQNKKMRLNENRRTIKKGELYQGESQTQQMNDKKPIKNETVKAREREDERLKEEMKELEELNRTRVEREEPDFRDNATMMKYIKEEDEPLGIHVYRRILKMKQLIKEEKGINPAVYKKMKRYLTNTQILFSLFNNISAEYKIKLGEYEKKNKINE